MSSLDRAARTTHQLARRPAAYTPGEPRPICPACWSRPDLAWGKDRRGWGVTPLPTPVIVDDRPLAATVSVYRCANAACSTAIELATLVASGYVPALVAAHQLAGADAARFAAGRTARDGVWRDARGEPRTTPAQRDLFG